MRRLALPLALIGLGCTRPPADIAEPTPEPAAPAPVFVEARPLECDGTLLAIIDGRGIDSAQFEHIYAMKERKYADRGRDIPINAARRYCSSISDRLIYQELLALEAAKRGVEYDAEALAEREAAQGRGIKDWAVHLRRRGEDDDSLRGLYVAELRERALLELDGSLAVSDEEVLAEYEKMKPDFVSDKPRIHAAQILIVVDEGTTDAQALARAEAAYQQAVLPDTDFAALARQESDGPSRRKGGDLGIFSADRIVDEFSKVAFKLKPGEVSRPVKTKFGYHVIKVYGAWGPGELPLEALEGQIHERLGARKLNQARRELKDRLFDEYAPLSCVESLAALHGIDWSPPPERPSARVDEEAP